MRIAQQLGLAERIRRNGKGLLICCPKHGEKNPSCSLRLGPDGTLQVKCFGCDLAGNVFTLLGAIYTGADFQELLKIGADLAGYTLFKERNEVGRAQSQPAPPPPPPIPPPAPIPYPPAAEVQEVWAACSYVSDDPAVSDWLRSRHLDPTAIDNLSYDDFALARALPPKLRTPKWAGTSRMLWSYSDYRCLIPVFDETGTLRSLRARRITPAAKEVPKALPACGYRSTGLIMADAYARRILATGKGITDTPPIVITEGEPDFLSAAVWYSDADLSSAIPAILGIYSGSWTQAIASRIPDGATVVIRTDLDPQGERYARQIRETLHTRCKIQRKKIAHE